MWDGLQSKNHLRRFDIYAIDVEVVGAVNFGAVQLRTTYKQMDQPVWKGES
jgi:hypothetical protein